MDEMAEVLSTLEFLKDYIANFQAFEPMTGIQSALNSLIPRLQAVKNGVDRTEMAFDRM